MISKRLILGFSFFLLLPFLDLLLGGKYQLTNVFPGIFVFTILAVGLHIVSGLLGLLNLGMGAFMAIGAYTYAIFTVTIFPFQVGFVSGVLLASIAGMFWGCLLALPTLRVRGDYLAIVTLGFGEIVQDILKNLEAITKGNMGLNPLPPPSFLGHEANSANFGLYYVALFALVIIFLWIEHIERSRLGTIWKAIGDDELAARSCGLSVTKNRVIACGIAASCCAVAGALYVSFLGSSGEPINYDFQVSVMAVAMVILGGLGSLEGALFGGIIVGVVNSILLDKVAKLVTDIGIFDSNSVLASPANWKYGIFGLMLVLTMRLKPKGLFGSRYN